MKKKSFYILLIFVAVILLTYLTGESYYRGIIEKAGLDKKTEKIYQYKYDMIVDRQDTPAQKKQQQTTTCFWRSWEQTEVQLMINWII